MIVKTAEATGLALDCGLAEALGYYDAKKWRTTIWAKKSEVDSHPICHINEFQNLLVSSCQQLSNLQENRWMAQCYNYKTLQVDFAIGSTPAEAVARCVISMKLGDEFEVPDELGAQS